MHNYWVGCAADVWRSGDKSVEFILREAGSGRGLRGGTRRAEQRNIVVHVGDEGRTRAWRLQVHRPEIVREPDAGLDTARPPRDGLERPQGAEGGARISLARREGHDDQRNMGRHGHARDAERRHGARGGVHSRRAHRARHSRGLRGRRLFRAVALRVGALRVLERVLRPGEAGVRAQCRARQRQGISGAHAIDGVASARAARSGGNGRRARGDRRAHRDDDE